MMGLFPIRRGALVLATALAFPIAAQAQHGAEDGEWRVYGGDPGHTRYSALDQINASNVADLEVAWRWTGRNFGPNPFAANQTTPLMIDGMLYATVGMRRAVVAIDPATGETIWTWTMDEGERLSEAPRANSGRGVAYWSDGAGDDRIYVITPGYHLAALDAQTGHPIPEFAGTGVLDLNSQHRTRDGIPLVGTIGASSPAAVVGNVLVVGSAHHVGMRPPSMVNTPGDVRGFDARTGELLWTFHTIPEPGEPGHETWLEDSWSYTGNAAVWAQISWDAEAGIVYLPTEAATGDYYGGHRPGNNLYSTAVVALNANTGEMIWHFQTIHHDIWDWDNPSAPILADLTIDGRQRQIVTQLSKQGFAFVFDRMTGEPIWPIEERPVPQTDVPGEWTSPTQPIPTRPAPFERQGFSTDDLIDFTPEIYQRALEIAEAYRWGPVYTPPSVRDGPDGKQGTLALPASTGGVNWEGGALDPETGYIYIPSVTAPSFLSLVEGGTSSDMNYIAGGGRGNLAPGVPIVKPPWGRITAIDLKTGDHAWMVPNGPTPDYVAERLELDPSMIPQTGKAARANIMVTRSLLFSGESDGPAFRALDKATGRTIAEIELPGATSGNPMTFMHQGRQYIVVAVSARGEASELVALTLPGN
ncbi:MAG: PQQ-binding-like beta-propeller repeat protein [Gemmatimonadota bacterium]|nr:PQQ-binding-like beta-propeller repeat protein [Gemmatimonadota bacterium]